MYIPARRAATLTFVLALLIQSAASAATLTPTATPTPSPTPSPEQVAMFEGAAWVDARASSGPVVAMIGGVECNSDPSSAGVPPDGGGVIYGVIVVSAQVKAGCGQEGSVVTFSVEGKQAEQTAVWHAHTTQFVNLLAGPPFAGFSGSPGIASLPEGESILPFIGTQACGNFKLNAIVGGGKAYEIHVYSTDQQQGCGAEGAQVAFKLVDAHGNVLATANQTGVWHAWDLVSPMQKLDLTFGPVGGVTVGSMGGGTRSGVNAWARLSLLLASLGLVGSIAGFALRKRAAMR